VSECEGPFVDFGTLQDGPVELVAGAMQPHEDVLVCSGCLRKALDRIPVYADRDREHQAEVRALRVEVQRARDVARALAQDVVAKLPSSVEEGVESFRVPLAVEPAPSSIDALKTGKQLREFAKVHGITLGADATTVDKIRARIEEALTTPGEQ
jgi:hypothetical protein